ncbi:MAG: hypothetical protein AB1726_13185 [Planctomycetota bacterium]
MRALSPLLPSFAPLALAVLLSSPPASAQSSRALLLEGDEIFGVGAVTGIQTFSINDNGEWLIVAETDAPAGVNVVVLRDGIPTFQEGDLVSTPPGATMASVSYPSFNRSGEIGWYMGLGNTNPNGDAGAFFNSRCLVREGTLSSASGFTPGTFYKAFVNVRINDGRQILCQASVDDPAVATSGDAAIVLLTLDESGYLLSEELLMVEGTAYDGLDPVNLLGSGTHTLAFNNRGDFLTFVSTTASSSYDGNIFYNWDSVAREGTLSPVPPRTWASLMSPRIDLNDYGDYVYTGTLSGDGETNLIIVKNTAKFMQKGDVVESVAPYYAQNFFSAPVNVTNGGKVVWFGQFSDPDASRNKGIFVDGEIVAQIGVTRVEGRFIKSINTFAESFDVPPQGRYLIYTGTLDDTRAGVFLIDLGEISPMESCYGNTGKLTHESGFALLGRRLTFQMDQGQGYGVTPIFLLSSLPIAGWPPCGLDAGPVGELLIDLSGANGNPVYYALGTPWAGAPVAHRLDIPNDANLVGLELFAQGLFWDIGNHIPEQNLLLTNAVHIVIAAP